MALQADFIPVGVRTPDHQLFLFSMIWVSLVLRRREGVGDEEHWLDGLNI